MARKGLSALPPMSSIISTFWRIFSFYTLYISSLAGISWGDAAVVEDSLNLYNLKKFPVAETLMYAAFTSDTACGSVNHS